MKIGLITYAVDLGALAKKPPPGGETAPPHPRDLGGKQNCGTRVTEQRLMERWARYCR